MIAIVAVPVVSWYAFGAVPAYAWAAGEVLAGVPWPLAVAAPPALVWIAGLAAIAVARWVAAGFGR